MILISLIGEQPIPNLLPIKYLNPSENILLFSDTTAKAVNRLERLISVKEKISIDPYDIDRIMYKINSRLDKETKLVFNITGGTKIMSAALFQVAHDLKSDFLYLQSEGNKSLLYTYSFQNDKITLSTKSLPELIDIDTYLKVHITDYLIDTSTTSGSDFENTISKTLHENNFEIIQNIRPKGEGNQLEIDLVIRLKGTNNVAIAEIKTGDRKEEGPKKGIDQLALAGQREYLGIYTKRFLITSRELSKQIKELAIAHGIIVIDRIEQNKFNDNLTDDSRSRLVNRMKEKLT